MLKIFGRKKRIDLQKPPEQSFLQEMSWPLRAVLKLRLNPFAGRVFFHDIICMAAKIASVDGPVSEIELKVFMELLEKLFSLSNAQQKKARQVLFEAHLSKKSFADFAKEFYRYFRKEPALLENAVDVLLSMVYADNVFSLGEQRLMAEVSEIFKLSADSLARLSARHHRHTTIVEKPGEQKRPKDFSYEHRKQSEEFGRADNQQREGDRQKSHRTHHQAHQEKGSMDGLWYIVLGVQPTDSPAVVKRRYRRLVVQYHPDKLPANIPEEMKRASTERFLAIQHAYESYLREKSR